MSTGTVATPRKSPGVLRRAVFARDGGRCVDCPPDAPPALHWDADHVIELADGGPDTLDNAVTRCRYHHRRKSGLARHARAHGRTLTSQPVLFEALPAA